MSSAALSELQPVALPETHQPAIAMEDVSRDFSRAIERAEVNAWLDLYRAAPADFAARLGLAIAEDDQPQRASLTRSWRSTAPPALRDRGSMPIRTPSPQRLDAGSRRAACSA
jgi:hypothetical protein